MKLKIKELHFDAAHYLPGIERCERIHGHTYILQNIVVEVDESKFVDFRKIKESLESLDHYFIVPKDEIEAWYEMKTLLEKKTSAKVALWAVEGVPTVENIAKWLKHWILNFTLGSVDGVLDIYFELFEGLNQGVESEDWSDAE